MRVLGKLNKTDLLTYRCSFVLKAYRNTIILQNGNGKFILASTVVVVVGPDQSQSVWGEPCLSTKALKNYRVTGV